jgi:hypothetical protein
VGEVLTLFFHKFFTVQAGGGPNPGQSHLEIRSQQNHRSCGTIKERSRIRGEIYRCRRAEITRLVHPGDASGDLAIKIKCVLVEKRSCISALFSNAIALGPNHSFDNSCGNPLPLVARGQPPMWTRGQPPM